MSWEPGYLTHRERDELIAMAKALSVITTGLVGIMEASFVESTTRKDDLGWPLVEPIKIELLFEQIKMILEAAVSLSAQLQKSLEGEQK